MLCGASTMTGGQAGGRGGRPRRPVGGRPDICRKHVYERHTVIRDLVSYKLARAQRTHRCPWPRSGPLPTADLHHSPAGPRGCWTDSCHGHGTRATSYCHPQLALVRICMRVLGRCKGVTTDDVAQGKNSQGPLGSVAQPDQTCAAELVTWVTQWARAPGSRVCG